MYKAIYTSPKRDTYLDGELNDCHSSLEIMVGAEHSQKSSTLFLNPLMKLLSCGISYYIDDI